MTAFCQFTPNTTDNLPIIDAVPIQLLSTFQPCAFCPNFSPDVSSRSLPSSRAALILRVRQYSKCILLASFFSKVRKRERFQCQTPRKKSTRCPTPTSTAVAKVNSTKFPLSSDPLRRTAISAPATSKAFAYSRSSFDPVRCRYARRSTITRRRHFEATRERASRRIDCPVVPAG